MMKKILLILFIFFPNQILAEGLDVFGVGVYDVKFDGSDTEDAIDYRYERRFDKSLLEIGPDSYDFFNVKPFAGFEITSESASYFLTGVYIEDDVGTLFTSEPSNFIFTPSFGFGYYDNGDGKNLGHNIQFRTTFELSYKLKSNNRLGISLGHISNANLGDKNPGVEIISLSFQRPY